MSALTKTHRSVSADPVGSQLFDALERKKKVKKKKRRVRSELCHRLGLIKGTFTRQHKKKGAKSKVLTLKLVYYVSFFFLSFCSTLCDHLLVSYKKDKGKEKKKKIAIIPEHFVVMRP